MLQGQSLSGASFTSLKQLQVHIDAYINAYNEKAEPFVWTKKKIRQRRFKGRRNSALIPVPGRELINGVEQNRSLAVRAGGLALRTTVFVAPFPHRAENRRKLQTLLGEKIFRAGGMVLVHASFDDAMIFQHLQPVRQSVRRYTAE
jgi:hypothetical protein